MLIAIDESGTFTASAQAGSGKTISVVGALVVPDCRVQRLLKKYASIRPNIPKESGEVNGRQLNEAWVVKIIDLLRKNEGLFFVDAIDMDRNTSAEIDAHK